ncbi:MAG TPA: cache domain-containing protein [Smithellaceae bacterium]|nr:cache domain-containing protein [Smithellaceae bacterium]HRS89773.1 cache domain-containing protein [Smithellaceae bacterium]HRV25149.1 cache domain-containing protein [Smithellaceae bacterium]
MKKFHAKEKTKIALNVLLTAFFLGAFVFAANVAQARDKSNIQCAKDTAVAVVHTAAVGLGEILKDVRGEKRRMDIIRSFIGPIRFYADNTGYFYVYDYQCVNIAHAIDRKLPGKNLYNYRDAKGKFVIRELSAAAKRGGGFVEYYWLKPGQRYEFRKIGYVEPIPGTNYFIGTGVYLPEWAPVKPGDKR